MDLSKLNPWNWFKHEQPRSQEQLPIKRGEYQPSQLDDPFDNLHREFDRMFGDLMRRWQFPGSEVFPQTREKMLPDIVPMFKPKLNIEALDKSYEVTIEVPGLDVDDISVELSGNLLVVKGKNEIKKEDQQAHYYRIERASGSFQRTLTLPDDADSEGISAKVDKGLMTISIPRTATDKSEVRQIPINH